MSPHDHNRVYAGSQFVHMTTDGGQSWTVISPDLTLNDKSKQLSSGGLTGDNIGPEFGDALMSIAESPKQAGVIWTGSNDGQVYVTRDGGKNWTNTSANIPGLPPWATIYTVEPSPFDAATAYITADLHQENNRDPFVYKTADFGKTWKNLSATIPKSQLSYTHCIKEDPARRGLLYLGTENGLYISFDDGEHWQSLQNNLPHVPVYGITVQQHFNDLVLATYGRGFWILDDISPLRQLTPEVTNAMAFLFLPRSTYRFRGITPELAPSYDATDGFNPAYGADLNYYLKSVPSGDVRISILNEQGKTVRTLSGTKDAGINRVQWDLRYSPSNEIRLRTPPIYGSWMRVPAEGRPAGGRIQILAPPGVYTVKLSVGGQEYTQKLTLIKDPHSAGTEADIRAQFTFLVSLRDSLNSAGEMVNRVELVRQQLEKMTEMKPQAEDLDRSLIAFEENLHQLRVTGGQDGMRWPAGLIEKLTHIASELQDVDFAPTSQQVAVNQQFSQQIQHLQTRFNELMNKDVADFNTLLHERGLPALNLTLAAAGN